MIGSICIGLMTSELNWGSVCQHRPGARGVLRTHEHGLDPLEQEMPDGTWEFGGDYLSASRAQANLLKSHYVDLLVWGFMETLSSILSLGSSGSIFPPSN